MMLGKRRATVAGDARVMLLTRGQAGSSRARLLYRAEVILLSMVPLAGILVAALSVIFDQRVAWGDWWVAIAPGLALIVLGLYARLRGAMDRLALATISVGYYLVLGNLVILLLYLRFPLSSGTIDLHLERLDAWIGYSWPDWVQATANVSWAGVVLATVYSSALLQLLLLMIALACMDRKADLHRYMLAGTAGVILTVVIWWTTPSFGPSALHAIPPDIATRVNPFMDGSFGAELARLAAEGNPIISPEIVVAVVAFPSYHTVMLCLVLWYARGTFLFGPALIWNVPMVPAILVQGGHHVMDMLGGLLVFAAGAALAARLVPRPGEAASPFRSRTA